VKLLYRYILQQFIKNIFMLMAGFVAIYVLIDFFEKIDDFMEKGKSMGLVLKFFFLSIPFILEQMGPVCILLAGVMTLGILNHSNELIALKACGIPLKKITAPIIAAGLAFTLLFLTMSQFVLPKTIAITNHIWNKEVKGRVALGIYRNGRFYYRGREGFYSFARPDLKSDKFLFFSYASWDPSYRLSSLIAAQQAVWQKGKWTLSNGQIQTSIDKGKFITEIFNSRTFGFPEKPSDFFVPKYHSMELSLTGLYQETRRKQAPDERNKAWAEFYGRISYTLLGIPLLLLGLPLLLFVYRAWGRDLSLAIPVSCGMAFACWGVWGTLQSLAKAGYLSPFLAASSIHLLVGLLGTILLLREDS
jgi:lipopolysaccharide export system permease protein